MDSAIPLGSAPVSMRVPCSAALSSELRPAQLPSEQKFNSLKSTIASLLRIKTLMLGACRLFMKGTSVRFAGCTRAYKHLSKGRSRRSRRTRQFSVDYRRWHPSIQVLEPCRPSLGVRTTCISRLSKPGKCKQESMPDHGTSPLLCGRSQQGAKPEWCCRTTQ